VEPHQKASASPTRTKVATGGLVNALQGIIRGYVGDVPGILNALKSATLAFGWGSKNAGTKKHLGGVRARHLWRHPSMVWVCHAALYG
jgi:hypothetical protein